MARKDSTYEIDGVQLDKFNNAEDKYRITHQALMEANEQIKELTNKLVACNNVKNNVNRTNRLLHTEIDKWESVSKTLGKLNILNHTCIEAQSKEIRELKAKFVKQR